jgi:succinyl-diaminopimelate desuccinylase
MDLQRTTERAPGRDAADPVVALACELVRCPSVTPEDAGCQAIVARRLEPLGFRCESIPSGGVTNLWARRGSAAPLVCFAGHTDVVPTGPVERWDAPPFAATLADGWLVGRGAADMKGSLAAFVVAVEDFVAAYPDAPGSLALLLTSDEEGPATDGTVRVVERLAAAGTRLDYCIVGEPSSVEAMGDMLKNGRRGSLSGTLVVEGVQGHIAYPHLAKNPIHLAAPVIAELAATEWDAGNDYFPPTTWQCSNVRAGTGATNVIPGTLEVDFNFRHGTASSRESLMARFEAVLRRYGLAYRLHWTGWGDPYLTPRGRLVDVASEAIHEVTGRRPELSTSGGTSDGRFLAAISDEVVELGPVNATIHQINERVRAADLVALAAVHRRLLERLLLPAARREAATDGASR